MIVSKLKVVFLIAGFDGGGAQKQCVFLLNELQKDESLDLHLIYFYEGVNFYLLEQSNISLHQIHSNSFYDFRNILRINGKIREIRPGVLISWLQSSDVYSYFLRKLNPRLKWMMTERDSSYPSSIKFKLRNFVGKSADLIVSNSRKGAEYWASKGYPKNSVRVVNNILGFPSVNRPDVAKTDHICVMYVGRLEPQKNVLNLTDFFIRLAENPKYHFYMIGEGTLKSEIEQKITESGYQDRFSLLPFQKHIVDYYRQADVFINISNHEGTPNTVIENIQLENRIIVSHIQEHVDLLGEEYPYYLKDLSNFEEFDQLMELILKSDNNLKADLNFGKRRLEEMIPARVAEQYVSIFKSISGQY